MAKKFVLSAIACYRMSSIIIDFHIFLGGQNEKVLHKKYGEMKLRNSS